MKNKTLKKTVSFLCASLTLATSFSGLAACNLGVTDDPTAEKIDPSRTQLYVFNYNSGFGTKWIDDIKQAYETLNANTIYEPGVLYNGEQKKGVQIVVKSLKENPADTNNMGNIPDGREEVFFTEQSYYFDLYKNNILGDITPAVTGDLSKRYVGYDENGDLINGDGMEDYGSTARETVGSTILSKMSETQQNYYNVDGSGKYYAVPHYAGYYGLTYNVDMFNARNYYFSASENTDTYDFTDEEAEISDWFISSANEAKSAGPDGQSGNEDDGLPATYKEFFMLCQYMLSRDDIPITWNGIKGDQYLTHFLQALVVDHDGLDNTMVTYNMDGTIDNLVDVTYTADGKVDSINFENTQEMTIEYGDGNAWNVSRSAGRYYALQFMHALLKGQYGKKDAGNNPVGYYKDGIFSPTNDHLTAQKDYVLTNTVSKGKIGMLVDGIWWENEAEGDGFPTLETASNGAWTKENCNFKFMPLPHATKEEIGQKRTVLDSLFSLCFMKKTIEDWKKPLAYDFIKFVNTHDQLVKFTQTTNTVKSLKYSLTPTEKESLTTFGKSVLNMRETADVVYPYATNAHYKADASGMFYPYTLFRYSESQAYASNQMRWNGTSGDDYFKNMVYYYKNNTSWTTSAKNEK